MTGITSAALVPFTRIVGVVLFTSVVGVRVHQLVWMVCFTFFQKPDREEIQNERKSLITDFEKLKAESTETKPTTLTPAIFEKLKLELTRLRAEISDLQ